MQEQPQGNGMAVAGMVLGILALVLCWVPFFDQILALLGIIFSALGVGKANRIGGRGKGMAVAGLVTAILGLLLGVVLIIWAMAVAKDTAMHMREY
jgi:hypothetical protein